MGNSSSTELAAAAVVLRKQVLGRDAPPPPPLAAGAAADGSSGAPPPLPNDPTALFARLFPSQPLTAVDVFSVLRPEDIRALRADMPSNLARAIVEVRTQAFSPPTLTRAHTHPHVAPSTPNTMQAVALMAHAVAEPKPATYVRAMNAVRVLTRILPIIQEAPDAPDHFCDALFWQNLMPFVAGGGAAAGATAAAAGTGAAAAGEAGAAPAAPAAAAPTTVWEAREGADPEYPLGTQLVHALMSMLFLPELTIDTASYDHFLTKVSECRIRAAATERLAAAEEGEAAGATAAAAVATASGGDAGAGTGVHAAGDADAEGDADEHADDHADEHAAAEAEAAADADPGALIPDEANAVWPMLLWHGGVGFPTVERAASSKHVEARSDLLRLLVALCSGPLYHAPSATGSVRSRFLDELTGGTCPFAPTLFY